MSHGIFDNRQKCNKCRLWLTVLDKKSGFGVEFDKDGICESCQAIVKRALASLEALKERKAQEKEQEKKDFKEAKKRKKKIKDERSDGRAWGGLTPEAIAERLKKREEKKKKKDRELTTA